MKFFSKKKRTDDNIADSTENIVQESDSTNEQEVKKNGEDVDIEEGKADDSKSLANSKNATVKKDKSKKNKKNNKADYDKVRKEDIDTIVKWSLPMVLLFAVWMIVRFAGSILNQPAAIEIAKQNATYIDIQNKIDIKTNEYNDMLSKNSVVSDFSYYTGDTSKDDKIAIAFFEHICTWNNSEIYQNLRDELLSQGYTVNDPIMLTLLPETETYFNEKEGKWQNPIDVNGENLKFESLTTYPLSVDGLRHSYAGILEISSKDNSEDGMNKEYFGKIYVTYVIENGKCCEAWATTLVEWD